MCDERNVSPYLRRRLRTLAEALRDRERRRAKGPGDHAQHRGEQTQRSAPSRRSSRRSDGEDGEP